MIHGKKDMPSEANIVVSNLENDVTAQDLDAAFKEFGDVVSSKVSYNTEGESNGYGFVQFASV
eukprot:CAMPEP_0168313158 /NCGR_PEP_ID=MMETSP0210-20121227/156_1 /TAXON_ID=40633 /ORGANISM="Condylostoma magnum, Strain COL2" /LENGTH=62 /DNA_ID=CAMNT_0008266425 /DNA_START=352 /DNA_END=540 /DNA_ORIENTATION=-